MPWFLARFLIRILARFLTRFWPDFGQILARFWPDFGQIWARFFRRNTVYSPTGTEKYSFTVLQGRRNTILQYYWGRKIQCTVLLYYFKKSYYFFLAPLKKSKNGFLTRQDLQFSSLGGLWGGLGREGEIQFYSTTGTERFGLTGEETSMY